MKNTIKTIALSLVMLLVFGFANASGVEGPDSVNKATVSSQQALRTEIVDLISRQFSPELSQTGMAAVTFKVDNTGKLSIKGVTSSEASLTHTVIQALNGAVINTTGIEAGQDYTIRIHFESLN